MDDLLSVSEAREKLLAAFRPVGTNRISLGQAAGRVLAEDISAGMDLPPFDNSSMDGFAVRAEDLAQSSSEHPLSLKVTGDIPAGSFPDMQLEPGQAARIMTGAFLPQGADAVIPLEDTDFPAHGPGQSVPEQVMAFRPVKPGDYVRPKGQDLHAGEVVFSAGSVLRPQDVGLLAMLGMAVVTVFRRPRLALLSTGDELVPVGTPLTPGKIYDSNSFILASLVQQYGGELVSIGVSPDQSELIEDHLLRAIENGVDLIISSAGVSVGAFDYVRSVVEGQGRLEFWRVNMRPGKPLAFGHYRGIPFIGLPGNPVSAFVGCEVFVRPAVLKLGGCTRYTRPALRVRLSELVESDGRESYLRASISLKGGSWVAQLTGHQGSGNLRSLVQANALLIIPSGVKSLPAGSETEAFMIEGPLTCGYPG